MKHIINIKLVILLLILLIAGLFITYTTVDYYKFYNYVIEGNTDSAEKILEEKPEYAGRYPIFLSPKVRRIMDMESQYPLCIACENDDFEMIRTLIENGADADCNDGDCPLSIIYQYKFSDWYEISIYLIEHGASVDYGKINDHPGRVFNDILSRGYDESDSENANVMKAYTFAYQEMYSENVDWGDVLWQCIMWDRVDEAGLLFERDLVNINETHYGETYLSYALRESSDQMVEKLLEEGADPSV